MTTLWLGRNVGQPTHNVLASLQLRSQLHNVFTALILQLQIHNIARKFPQRWISKFISQHDMNNVMEKLIKSCNHNVEFTTSSRRRCCDFASTLIQFYIDCQIGIICDHMATFPQRCLKAVKKFNNDMIVVWYAGSTLWHLIQSIFPLIL